MTDIHVMRPRHTDLCTCGSALTAGELGAEVSSGRTGVCGPCREADEASTATTRSTLTELVADERGYALHRRTLPGTNSTVAHLFVGASGVFVIHVERAPEAEVAVRRAGGRFAPNGQTLSVGGRDASVLVDAVSAQCAEVTSGLAGAGHGEVPVIPVLCFTDAQLSRWARNRRLGEVRLTDQVSLANEVAAEGPLDADRRFAVAMSLVSLLPSPH